MNRRAAACCLALAALALDGAHLAAQSVFTLSGSDGRFGARLMRRSNRSSTNPVGTYLLQTTEWVLLNVDGVVLDPGLFRFGATLQPQWTQSNGGGGKGAGFRNLAWSARANLLHNGRPYWMTFSAGQSQAVRRDQTGFSEERWHTHYAGSVHVLFPGLPTELRYRHDGQSATFSNAVLTSFANSSLRLDASNSKTRVLLERLWLASGDGPTIGQWQGNVGHRQQWGKGSTWNSQVAYLRYDAGNARTRWSWTESGRIRHTSRVSTNLALRYTTTRSDISRQSIWSTGIGVSYPFGPGLTGSTSFGSQWTRRAIDREQRLSLAQSLGFGYRLPGNVRLSGGGSVGFVRVKSEVGQDRLADVVAEQHVVEPDGSFILENPAVDPASIRVLSGDRGILYQAGLDYEVLASGPFTLLTLVPASRIAIGDALSVDYAYALPLTGPSDQLAAAARAQLDVGPFEAFVRIRRTQPLSETPAGGIDNFYLSDLNENEFGLRVAGRVLFGHANGGVTRLLRRSGTFDYALTSVNGSFKMRLPARFSAHVGGGVSWSGRAENQTRTLSASGGISWSARRFLSAWASGGTWTVSQSLTDLTRSHLGGRVGASFRIALVSIEMDYQIRTWTTDGRRTDDRFSVRMERSF